MDSKSTGITDIIIGICDAVMTGVDIATGQYLWAIALGVLAITCFSIGVYLLVQK